MENNNAKPILPAKIMLEMSFDESASIIDMLTTHYPMKTVEGTVSSFRGQIAKQIEEANKKPE